MDQSFGRSPARGLIVERFTRDVTRYLVFVDGKVFKSPEQPRTGPGISRLEERFIECLFSSLQYLVVFPSSRLEQIAVSDFCSAHGSSSNPTFQQDPVPIPHPIDSSMSASS